MDGTPARLLLDSDLYPFEALRIASARFARRCEISVRKVGTKFRVLLQPSRPQSTAQKKLLASEFLNEAVNVLARAELSRGSGKARELIFTQALYSAIPAPDARAPMPEALRSELQALFEQSKAAQDKVKSETSAS